MRHKLKKGLRQTPEYGIWASLRRRCLCHTNKDFKWYGGRGIKSCKRWDYFVNFLKDMGKRPIGLTLDRINNDGDYKPSNCRWADRKTQTNNKNKKWYVRSSKILSGNKDNKKRSQIGENHGRAKLTQKEVIRIRFLYEKRHRIASLSKIFNVSTTNIGHIVRRWTWRHI